MYALQFEGWAQCRMPTDPDPSNDPRGVSGYSFALPGEPDMDRLIYFQDQKPPRRGRDDRLETGVVQRSYCPDIGVTVKSGLFLDAKRGVPEELPDSNPLIGAAIDLAGRPEFDSRNYVLVNFGFGVITPFEFRIQGRGITIERSLVMDPDNPRRKPIDMSEKILDQFEIKPVIGPSALHLTQSKIVDPVIYRSHRLKELRGELRKLRKDPDGNAVAIAALDKRIEQLEIRNPENRRTAQIPNKALCLYQLNSPDARVNRRKVSVDDTWNLEMWLGGWDADALSFYVTGAVIVTGLDSEIAKHE